MGIDVILHRQMHFLKRKMDVDLGRYVRDRGMDDVALLTACLLKWAIAPYTMLAWRTHTKPRLVWNSNVGFRDPKADSLSLLRGGNAGPVADV